VSADRVVSDDQVPVDENSIDDAAELNLADRVHKIDYSTKASCVAPVSNSSTPQRLLAHGSY
jgi:hypothetical protein